MRPSLMMGAGFVMLLTVAPARWGPGTWAALEYHA